MYQHFNQLSASLIWILASGQDTLTRDCSEQIKLKLYKWREQK